MTSLTEQQQAVLAFEHQRWQHPGAKDTAVREQFGLTPTRYYQMLGELLDDERAFRHDPVLVARLRRVRDARRARRAG